MKITIRLVYSNGKEESIDCFFFEPIFKLKPVLFFDDKMFYRSKRFFTYTEAIVVK